MIQAEDLDANSPLDTTSAAAGLKFISSTFGKGKSFKRGQHSLIEPRKSYHQDEPI